MGHGPTDPMHSDFDPVALAAFEATFGDGSAPNIAQLVPPFKIGNNDPPGQGQNAPFDYKYSLECSKLQAEIACLNAQKAYWDAMAGSVSVGPVAPIYARDLDIEFMQEALQSIADDRQSFWLKSKNSPFHTEDEDGFRAANMQEVAWVVLNKSTRISVTADTGDVGAEV